MAGTALDPVEALRRVSLFSRLGDRQLKMIYRACARRHFAAGDTVVEQGNAGVGLFIILDGQVRVWKTLKDGTVVDLARNGPGDVIGEMSVLDGASRTASVQADSPVDCLVLSSWSFKAIMERKPEVALGILPIVVQRFRETSDALVEIRNSRSS